MKKRGVCVLFFSMFSAIGLLSADRPVGRMFATRSVVAATQGMVATSQPLAVQIGLDILKQGGNAVDAAIAVNAALGLMEPTGSGIGGDLFVIVWDQKTAKLHGLNASGPAPRSISLAALKAKGLTAIPLTGPLPWTVPGCVAGWFELHKKFGRLPFNKILAPAIAYAKKGFPVSELIASHWGLSVRRFRDIENFQKLYAPGGRAPGHGDIFRNPELARTYRLLAEKGRDAYYKGEIARAIVAYSAAVGGYFSLEDFAAYQPEWVEPLTVTYRGYQVWELPPNGQGMAVLQMLNLLKTFDLPSLGHNSAAYLHTLIEIKKLVYEDIARFYADPRFSRVPVQELLSDQYTRERLKLFNPEKANWEIAATDPRLGSGDTVYLTVADAERNVVSMIQSNYAGFGSGMVPPGLGFCLHDRGALFSLDENHPNVIAPGKRPFHTIIPAMVTKDGKPVFSFGVMGGDMQPQGQVQVLLNMLEFGMNPQEAGDAPRFYHVGSSEPTGEKMTDGGMVFLENGVEPEAVRGLLQKGHRAAHQRGDAFGGFQGIWIDYQRGILMGASESRKDGCAAGY